MCLGIPGRVTRWVDRDPVFARAEIDFDGIRRECHMACVLDAEPGDFIIVHAGIGISRVDSVEAHKILKSLAQLGEIAAAEEAFQDEIPK